MSHIILIYHRMVLNLSTGYRLLVIVYLDQLQGAHHTHTSSHDSAFANQACFFQLFPT